MLFAYEFKVGDADEDEDDVTDGRPDSWYHDADHMQLLQPVTAGLVCSWTSG